MCDFCGCPTIAPFSHLTDEHASLTTLAEAFERSGDLDALEALAVGWDDHRAHERVALEDLAAELAMTEDLELARPTDDAVEGLLSQAMPGAKELRLAIASHADVYEYEIFPHLVLMSDDHDIEVAAERAARAQVA